jgi:hypothetical protein
MACERHLKGSLKRVKIREFELLTKPQSEQPWLTYVFACKYVPT